MKKNLLLLAIFSFTCLNAQVGINTENPQGVLHVDAAGNTNGAANTSDDVVVSTTGNVGVGTIAPAAKVDIRTSTASGGLRLQDGTQGAGKVLSSDANGNASWTNLIPGITAGTHSTTNIALSNSYKYLGMFVSVPPGKSQVYVGGMVREATAAGYVTMRLSDSSTSLSLAGITQTPGLAGFAVHQSGVSVGQVTFFVNNANPVAKTLYLWGIIAGSTSALWAHQGVAEPFIFVAY